MKIKHLLYISLLMLMASCVKKLEELSYEKSLDRIIENIRKPYNGIIIDTISYRKNLRATDMILSSGDTIFPTNGEVMKLIKIGDSVYKKGSDNFLYIQRKPTDKTLKLWYIKIPQKYREDDRFPMKWKGKWMDASE